MVQALSSEQGLRLLMQHRAALYAYLLTSVRDHATAEDLLQDVFVAVLDSLAQLQNEQGFLPWAREIARRRILSSKRHSNRMRAVDPDLIAALSDAAERVESQCATPHLQEALRQCLDSLPGESRQIVLYRYQDSVDGIEKLAERMQRSVQAVYATLKRIKSNLRDCVKRRLAGEVRI